MGPAWHRRTAAFFSPLLLLLVRFLLMMKRFANQLEGLNHTNETKLIHSAQDRTAAGIHDRHFLVMVIEVAMLVIDDHD